MILNLLLGEGLGDQFEVKDHLSDGDMKWVGEYQTANGEILGLPAFREGTKSDVRGDHDPPKVTGPFKQLVIGQRGTVVGLSG